MDASAAGGSQVAIDYANLTTSVLKAAQEMPAEQMEKLLAVNAEMAVQEQQMALIGRLIDVYV